MKVLWVTSQILPLVANELDVKTSGFGGWVMNMLCELDKKKDIEIGIVMVSDKVKEIKTIKVDRFICYVAPEYGKKNIKDEYRDEILNRFIPDIIHIEGNEFGIQNKFSKVKKYPVLVSLQGILSGYEPYQYGEIQISDHLFNIFDKHFLPSWTIFFRKKFRFNKRLAIENETISNANYLTGRTFWDRAHSYWLNSRAYYFECNRILRPVFYSETWDINEIEEKTLFVGNGYSPLKGLHFVLEAVNLLKKEYKNIKLYVAGNCPVVEKNKISLHKFGYSMYIKQLIKKYDLEKQVIFTGSLNGEEMVKVMKKCNIYVLPSLIENSPNTLGEAMILGMPCVSAYTGGASQMAIDEKECLFYRANDPNLLAWQVKRLFDDKNLAIKIGENAKKHARITHNAEENCKKLIEGYNKILENSKSNEK